MAKGAALLGVGALLLLMARRDEDSDVVESSSTDDSTDEESPSAPGAPSEPVCTCADLLDAWESPAGQPLTGRLYQVVSGDTGLLVARKALFGTTEPRLSPSERDSVIELSIRIDCGPWNQTMYGRKAADLNPGHYAVERGYTDKGVYYMPVFPDNRERLAEGESPLVGRGSSFPFLWVPKIDLHKFMQTGEITTLGQNYPDDGQGSYNMIDPPPWIIDLQFEGDLKPGIAGCALPEGDFSKEISFDDDDDDVGQ